MQRADDIQIAVQYILSDPSNEAVEACGMCDPRCDDLTRFICMGYTNVDIDKWIVSNSETLRIEKQKSFDTMLADYINACYESSEQVSSKDKYSERESSVNYGCAGCTEYKRLQSIAINKSESVFDAVAIFDNLLAECKNSCNKIVNEGD